MRSLLLRPCHRVRHTMHSVRLMEKKRKREEKHQEDNIRHHRKNKATMVYRPPPPFIMNGRVRPAVLVSIIGVTFPVGSFVKSFAYSSLAPSALSTRINWGTRKIVSPIGRFPCRPLALFAVGILKTSVSISRGTLDSRFVEENNCK